jgi:hypothetical protein
MKKNKGNDSSSYAGKKATLQVPKGTGRHKNPAIKSTAGAAMASIKLKK